MSAREDGNGRATAKAILLNVAFILGGLVVLITVAVALDVFGLGP